MLGGVKFKDDIKVTDDDNETTDEKVAGLTLLHRLIHNS